VEQLRALISALPEGLRRQAFTHASWAPERGASYERLEFLGDAVLGLAIADELARRFSGQDEGWLSAARNEVVSRRSCALVARVLDLGAGLEAEAIRSGADASTVATTRSVLAGVCESVIGACFVAHAYPATALAVVEAFAGVIARAAEGSSDPKSELQEQAARLGASLRYEVMDATGPPHRRRFTSAAIVSGDRLGVGSGPSIKASEQAAARAALDRLAGGDAA